VWFFCVFWWDRQWKMSKMLKKKLTAASITWVIRRSVIGRTWRWWRTFSTRHSSITRIHSIVIHPFSASISTKGQFLKFKKFFLFFYKKSIQIYPP
jgi:hypothetical protein